MKKNLIADKIGKKQESKFSKYASPSFITKHNNILSGVASQGFGKEAYFDSTSTIPNFYTPELTPDTWLLPRSRAEILRWPLLEGEKVWCNGKFVNIEDIKIGDKVLASNGKEQTVLNTMSKEADDVGVEIITRFAPPVQFGGNHPIWAVDTNKSTEYVSKCFRTCLYNNAISFDTVAKWYDAKDIKPGFMVKIPKYKIEKDIQIDLADYLPEETSHGYRFNVLEDTINYKLGQTDLTISRHLPLNNEVFEFLGWYIAKGHIHKNSILLTLAYDEILIAKHLKEVLLSNFNIEEETINISDHNGSYRLSINNTVLASFILKNFNTGSKDKFIPQWLLDFKKELIISFLRGWIKGDGKITDEALEDQTSGFSLTTTSEQLSKMGYMLFNKVGCIVGVKEEHQTLAEAQKKAGFKYTTQSCAPVVYYLTANGNRVKNIFPELTYTEKVCPNFYEDEDYYYTTVKSVKIFETTKRFHCVTTEDHTICVPYITHNCRLFFNLDPYINSILTMHAQYPICNFRLKYKDKETEAFFNRKLFDNKEFSWIDFLEQIMLSYWKLGEACLTGDTNIHLLDGTTKTLKELYDSKARDFWVYSVDDKGNIIGSKADEVVLTRKNAELVKITLDNGESFRCTPDHKIMLRDGSYKEAKDLLPNDALMPLYYKDSYVYYNKNHSKHKYEIVYNPGNMTLDQNSGHWKFTHRVISLHVNGDSKGKIIHHKNFNNKDNRPENLEVLSYSEHRVIHTKEYTEEEIDNFRQKTKDNYNKPGYREKISKAISQGMTPKVRKILSEKSKAFWCKDENREMARKNSLGRKHTPETISKLKAVAKERYLKNPEDVMNRLKKATAAASEANKGRKHTDEYKQKMSKMMKERWEKGIYKNHKVLKVESCGYEDVYDIHSSGEFHNFAIETGKGSGVFVHNCVWGDFNEAKGTWNSFSLIDPSLIEYKEDPLSGEVEMSILPTRELKQMLADALKQGRNDVPVEYIKCVQENQKIPLDATGTEPNYLTGKKYSPAKVFMMVRKTDPGSTRGTPIIQSLFKCVTGDTRVALVDGTNPTIKELAESGKKDFWVYGADKEGNIVVAKAECAAYIKDEETVEVTLDNGAKVRCTKDHPFFLRDMTKVEAQNLKPGDSLMSLYREDIQVVSVVPTGKVEPVYCVANAGENHNFMITFEDGSGILSGNTLIYSDKIRLAQIAIADRLHLPMEIWSIGSFTGDPNTSIIPDDSMIANVREAIREATMQPPFSIFVPPYIKYEAVGVNGKLLSVYEDLGYVENCIFVALGVNKNLILGMGPSFSSSKQTSLFKLIKMYKMMRLKLESFIKKNIILPIAKANDVKDEYGDFVVPDIEWEESLSPEQDVEKFNNVLKLWDKGLVSTTTLYEYFPGKLDINLEKQRMEEEKLTIFDKGTDRLGSKEQRLDLKNNSNNKRPKPSDGSKPAENLPPPLEGDIGDVPEGVGEPEGLPEEPGIGEGSSTETEGE